MVINELTDNVNTHTHEAVTGHVEAKKLLSQLENSQTLHVVLESVREDIVGCITQ